MLKKQYYCDCCKAEISSNNIYLIEQLSKCDEDNRYTSIIEDTELCCACYNALMDAIKEAADKVFGERKPKE